MFAKIKSEKDLNNLKKKISAGGKFPSNAEVLELYRKMIVAKEIFPSRSAELVLRKKKTKSNSGVVSVSVLTKPYPCPGKCLYCPSDKESPKSYLSKEPAVSRAIANDFDPYKQITMRLQALQNNGHPVDKVEVIVIGGTWSFYPKKYQENFIAEIFRACNRFGTKYHKTRGVVFEDPLAGVADAERDAEPAGSDSRGSEKIIPRVLLQKLNEKAKCRVVGLSIETRPDFIDLKEIEWLRKLGVTKVEMGVQHLDDKILALNKRGINTEEVARATAMLRANGFKIVYHMILNLYGSSPAKDIAMFKKLFSDARFYPDMLKIYPCVLLKNSGLYKIWKQGKFKLYSDKKLIEVLAEIKKNIPPFVRIIRVIRDIPSEYIVAGSKVSNMRQYLEDDQRKNGWHCKCIRCREIREEEIDANKLRMKKVSYKVSSGEEIFLSWECGDKLAAFLRLFLSCKSSEVLSSQNPTICACWRSVFSRAVALRDVLRKQHLAGFDYSLRLPILKNCAIIRELHTYGRLAKISDEGNHAQHIGLGKKLLAEAEKIARKAGFKKMAVISGVGARGYYRKFGYALRDSYMVKGL